MNLQSSFIPLGRDRSIRGKVKRHFRHAIHIILDRYVFDNGEEADRAGRGTVGEKVDDILTAAKQEGRIVRCCSASQASNGAPRRVLKSGRALTPDRAEAGRFQGVGVQAGAPEIDSASQAGDASGSAGDYCLGHKLLLKKLGVLDNRIVNNRGYPDVVSVSIAQCRIDITANRIFPIEGQILPNRKRKLCAIENRR